MSAAFVLPFLQARAEFHPAVRSTRAVRSCRLPQPVRLHTVRAQAETICSAPLAKPRLQMAFYRKYTEALLQRYMRMSLEVGRVPSLLGREMFRAKVSCYRMESFEDSVIFCHDVERCIHRLSAMEQSMIERIALKQYTVLEASETLGICRQTIIRQYTRALDRLTAIFLDTGILNPTRSLTIENSKRCQAPQAVENSPTSSI